MNKLPALPIHDFADSKLFITPAAHRVIRKSGTGQAIDDIYTLCTLTAFLRSNLFSELV